MVRRQARRREGPQQHSPLHNPRRSARPGRPARGPQCRRRPPPGAPQQTRRDRRGPLAGARPLLRARRPEHRPVGQRGRRPRTRRADGRLRRRPLRPGRRPARPRPPGAPRRGPARPALGRPPHRLGPGLDPHLHRGADHQLRRGRRGQAPRSPQTRGRVRGLRGLAAGQAGERRARPGALRQMAPDPRRRRRHRGHARPPARSRDQGRRPRPETDPRPEAPGPAHRARGRGQHHRLHHPAGRLQRAAAALDPHRGRRRRHRERLPPAPRPGTGHRLLRPDDHPADRGHRRAHLPRARHPHRGLRDGLLHQQRTALRTGRRGRPTGP